MGEKRPRHSRGFNGALSGGRGKFMRGQSSKTTYSVPPPSRDAPVRPYLNAIFESSYRQLAIQGSSSGYLGSQGQSSSALGDCYEYREVGQIRRFFPRIRGKEVQQGHQPMITASTTPQVVRPTKDGEQVHRGRARGGGQSDGAPARFYAFPARSDVVSSDAVITGIISVCGRDTSVLFDPESTYSYVSSLFAHFLDVSRESLGAPVYVSMTAGVD
ncbi:uncharacterized protein [Nicotiana tomentosiformis]|uniref:uncharacterized protein n=1 Tax=Nicotiana tomentosiformis TaxID=4098 RepID=UPI00388C52D5